MAMSVASNRGLRLMTSRGYVYVACILPRYVDVSILADILTRVQRGEVRHYYTTGSSSLRIQLISNYMTFVPDVTHNLIGGT